jgi:hypothetical protein
VTKALVVEISQLLSILVLSHTEQALVPNAMVNAAQGADIKSEDIGIVFECNDVSE